MFMMIADNDVKNIEISEVKKLDNNELGEVSGGAKLGDIKEMFGPNFDISTVAVAYGALTAPKLRLPLKTKPSRPTTKYGIGIPSPAKEKLTSKTVESISEEEIKKLNGDTTQK